MGVLTRRIRWSEPARFDQCSEMAGRVVDAALQILGGRGYMRENPVERLYHDLRVDRIWEGTSEFQRAIIGGQIKQRGLGVYTDW